MGKIYILSSRPARLIAMGLHLALEVLPLGCLWRMKVLDIQHGNQLAAENGQINLTFENFPDFNNLSLFCDNQLMPLYLLPLIDERELKKKKG